MFQVELLTSMISMAATGLTLSYTFSQIEDLKRDANDLSIALSGLATGSTGRSFPLQYEINEVLQEGIFPSQFFLVCILLLRLLVFVFRSGFAS